MRTFIAIEITETLKRNLKRSLGVIRSELDDGLMRWARPESMHLTLNFLGEIELEQVQVVQENLEEVTATFPSFNLEIAGLGFFPDASRPRVAWAGIEPADGELMRIQTELARRLEEIGIERERRDYHPHLTLGRVRKGLSRDDMQQVSEWAQSSQLDTVGGFDVRAISLIHSVLRPEGATHSTLHEARLAG